MPPFKTPNSPEYVEVVKSDIRESADEVEFEFNFARKIRHWEVEDLMNNREGTLWQTIAPVLFKKGWVSENGEDALVPMQVPPPIVSEKGKRWTFAYRRVPQVPHLF